MISTPLHPEADHYLKVQRTIAEMAGKIRELEEIYAQLRALDAAAPGGDAPLQQG